MKIETKSDLHSLSKKASPIPLRLPKETTVSSFIHHWLFTFRLIVCQHNDSLFLLSSCFPPFSLSYIILLPYSLITLPFYFSSHFLLQNKSYCTINDHLLEKPTTSIATWWVLVTISSGSIYKVSTIHFESNKIFFLLTITLKTLRTSPIFFSIAFNTSFLLICNTIFFITRTLYVIKFL